MLHRSTVVLVIGLLAAAGALILASCGPSEGELAGTIVAQVRAGVGATVSAWPTFTPAATLTPRPTLTTVPTTTPRPTLTPGPTLTAQPTYTPNPTYTPWPSLTPSPTSEPRQAQPTAAAPIQQPAGGLALDEFGLMAIRGSFTQVARFILPRDTEAGGPYWLTGPGDVLEHVDCVRLLEAHAGLMSRLLAPPSDPRLQPAYNEYQAAVDLFLAAADPYVTACQASGGQDLPALAVAERSSLQAALDTAKHKIQGAISLLPEA